MKLPTEKLEGILMDYLIHMKKEDLKHNTIQTQFAGIEFLLDVNKISYNKKHIRRYFPTKNKIKGHVPYSLEDLQKMYSVTKSSRDKALLLFMASSGVRSGAIPYLKVGHVEDFQDCKLVRVYAGEYEEYLTFITPEASEALDMYLDERRRAREMIDTDSPLFRKAGLSGRLYDYSILGGIKRSSIWSIISRLVEKSGVVSNV